MIARDQPHYDVVYWHICLKSALLNFEWANFAGEAVDSPDDRGWRQRQEAAH
jgi:hypothetical protein